MIRVMHQAVEIAAKSSLRTSSMKIRRKSIPRQTCPLSEAGRKPDTINNSSLILKIAVRDERRNAPENIWHAAH